MPPEQILFEVVWWNLESALSKLGDLTLFNKSLKVKQENQ